MYSVCLVIARRICQREQESSACLRNVRMSVNLKFDSLFCGVHQAFLVAKLRQNTNRGVFNTD